MVFAHANLPGMTQLLIKKGLHQFFSFFLPSLCNGCNKLGQGQLCDDCTSKVMNNISLQYDAKTDVYFLAAFEGTLRTLINRIKFEKNPLLADQLGSFIHEKVTHTGFFHECAAWIPTPMYKRKYQEREFNQVDLLFEPLFNALSIPKCRLIERVSNTDPLFDLSPVERKQELRDCFVANDHLAQLYKNKTVVVCDDIFTTGSTIMELEKTLRPYQIRVERLVVCKAT